MTTTTETLVDLCARLLKAGVGEPPTYPTSCGPRVYAPRDWPTASQIYPAAFVSGPRERKRSLGSSTAPEYQVTSTIRVAVRAELAAQSPDGDDGALLDQLGGIRRQIEVCLINNPALAVLLSEFGDVNAEAGFKSPGDSHLGELLVELDLSYYQGPEDFFPVDGASLEQLTLSTPFPTPLGPPVGLSVIFPSS